MFMQEFYVLIAIIIILAILFVVGLRANNNAMIKYAEQIRNLSLPFCKFVGFRRYGRGFKALCIPKEGGLFSRIDVTLSLTWRENPLYYLLSPLTKDKDHILVWGSLTKRCPINIEICKEGYLSQLKLDSNLEKIELSQLGMIVITDNLDKTRKFLDKIEESLLSSKDCIDSISIKESEGWVKIVARILGDSSIKNVFNLLMRSGQVIKESI